MKRKILCVVMILTLVAAFSGCGDKAGAEYPSASAVTMIINYSAGGGTDLCARALGDAAAEALGGTITANNVTGGTGTVGVAELANSSNDGYTIGVATLAPLALVPWQMDVTYTPEDFEYVCAFGQYGYGILVSADCEYQTIDDLIEAAKNETIKFGATGYPQPFAMDDLSEETGASFEFVSYPATTDLVTDILGGFIDVAVADEASFSAYVKSGEMRLLAGATDQRWFSAPDVETLQEMGYDVVLQSYLGIAVPAGIDETNLATLRDAFAKAVEDEDFINVMNNANQHIDYLNGEDYEQLVKDKYQEYKTLFNK